MIDFRSGREPKSSSFDFISIRIASPEEIRGPRDPKERERMELQALGIHVKMDTKDGNGAVPTFGRDGEE